jgi:hypothetical protein
MAIETINNGETGLVVRGKINDNFSELVTLIAAKIATSSIINNLTTGGTAVPLSAQQGVALKALIDAIDLSGKVNISSIVNDLTTGGTAVPLSAEQGKTLKGLIDTINSLLTSDETTLDTLQEIVDFIELNREDLDALTIASIAGLQTALDAKIAITSIVNDLTTGGTAVPLSAQQGVALKALIDAVTGLLKLSGTATDFSVVGDNPSSGSDVRILGHFSFSNQNILDFGGGNSSYLSATTIRFWIGNTWTASGPGNQVMTLTLKGIGVGTIPTHDGTRTVTFQNGTEPTSNQENGVILYSKDVNGSSELFVRTEAGEKIWLSRPDIHILSLSPTNPPLILDDPLAGFYAPYTGKFLTAEATVRDYSADDDIIVEIKVNGVSILTDPLTIDDGDVSSSTSASPYSFDSVDFDKGDFITFSATQIDSGGNASMLQVTVTTIPT